MAEIFRAKTFDHDGQPHLVAVKRVLAHLVEDQDFLQMLVDEAKISALLHHENIARVYEFAKSGDEYFLAMEYVDGKDVRSLLERGRQGGRPIPPEHVAWVAMETAHALHAAHTQRDGAGRALRIVHRDVSPSNLLCSYHGEVKLCDFGIAKATLTRVQTKTGVIKGKVKYMSPEQAMGRKLDHRSDLFSLGTVMYEMLTLQAPFQAPTEVELIFAVRDARKVPLHDVAPDVPDELMRIVDRAMTRSRSNRYQSGEEMALELRIFLDRHTPGYRRSHFARHMRKVFEEDIERELRLLEAYVIDQADEKQTGVNLIAEALGPDAPVTQFTPMFGGPGTGATQDQTSHYPHLEPVRPSDLHGQPTMMLDRARLGLPPEESGVVTAVPSLPAPASLHDERTRLLAPAQRSIHDEETGEKALPRAAGGAAPSLYELDTGAVRKIDPPDLTVPTDRMPPIDDGQGTGAAESPSDLHAQATMIFMNPLGEGPLPDLGHPGLAAPPGGVPRAAATAGGRDGSGDFAPAPTQPTVRGPGDRGEPDAPPSLTPSAMHSLPFADDLAEEAPAHPAPDEDDEAEISDEDLEPIDGDGR